MATATAAPPPKAAPTLVGWRRLQRVFASTAVDAPFLWPATADPITGAFIGEPHAIVLNRTAAGALQLADAPSDSDVMSMHALINFFQPDTASVRVVAGDAAFLRRLLGIQYQHGIDTKFYELSFQSSTGHRGPNITIAPSGGIPEAQQQLIQAAPTFELADAHLVKMYIDLLHTAA